MKAGTVIVMLAFLAACGADGRPVPPGADQAQAANAGTGTTTLATPVANR